MGRCNHWTWHGTHLFEYTKKWQRNVAVGEGISSVRKALQAGGLHGSKSPTIFDAHMRQRWPTHACLHIWHRLNQSQPRTPPSPRSKWCHTIHFPLPQPFPLPHTQTRALSQPAIITHTAQPLSPPTAIVTALTHTAQPPSPPTAIVSHCFHTYSPTRRLPTAIVTHCFVLA